MIQRWIRDFKLILQVGDQEVIITNPLKITFTCSKAIGGGLNKMNLEVYNLKRKSRELLIKDKEESKIISIELKVGYENTILKTIYKGTVHFATSIRDGADIITTIEGIDGGVDALDKIYAQSIKGKNNVVDYIVTNSSRLQKGKFTIDDNSTRPIVAVGSAFDILNKIKSGDDYANFFIDNEMINIIKEDEVITSFIPKIDSSTGLISTPIKQMSKVSFTCLLNIDIKLAGMIDLESTIQPRLNGIYRVERIEYQGDSYSGDWLCNIEAYVKNGYKVV